MSIATKIQWCDSTVNPAMGCDGCELFPKSQRISSAIRKYLAENGIAVSILANEIINSAIQGKLASELYHGRRELAARLLSATTEKGTKVTRAQIERLARAIAKPFVCYAGILHLRHGKDPNKPNKRTNKGYAPLFEKVTPFPGRMAGAAAWPDLAGTNRGEKPWLNGLRRSIFVSDMSDLLSAAIDFEYIRDEVIVNVTSTEGQRHVWLWLTKRPQRMAKFSEWLDDQGIAWPDNLIAMTSVTSQQTVGRVEQLKKVRCRHRGLSVEPLRSAVDLPLQEIDWVIVGGESGAGASPFEIEWARGIRRQCRQAGAAFFIKQLGTCPVEGGTMLELKDGHGGDWAEWPKDLRIRELPVGFKN